MTSQLLQHQKCAQFDNTSENDALRIHSTFQLILYTIIPVNGEFPTSAEFELMNYELIQTA